MVRNNLWVQWLVNQAARWQQSRLGLPGILLSLCLVLTACPARNTPTATPAPSPTRTPIVPTATPQPMNLMDTLAAAENLKTLTTALQAADLVEKLESPGPFTIFAPTDEAFATLTPNILDDQARFFDLLLHHVVAGRIPTSTLTSGTTFTSLLGDDLTISISNTVGTQVIQIDNATLTGNAIPATNGLIYVIDQVLEPAAAAGAIANNLSISNPSNPAITSSVTSALPTVGSSLIPEVLAADPRFRTLVRALHSTGVYTELQGAGPFTLLAPIDDAFASLPSPLADSVFEGTPVWIRVLRFHIIPGEQGLAIEIENEQSKRTLEGSDILFLRKQGTLFANEAEIIEPDIETANGIIHVIDTVLVPPLD